MKIKIKIIYKIFKSKIKKKIFSVKTCREILNGLYKDFVPNFYSRAVFISRAR